MATTSLRQQDLEGIEPLDVDPYLIVNHNHELNELQESSDLPDQEDTNSLEWINVQLEYFLPLYRAALNGDWERANSFINRDPNACEARISILSMTALHVAASVGCSQFVENLVDLMPTEALALQDFEGMTALHYVAMSGSLMAAKAMVRKNPALTQIMDYKGFTPLSVAYKSSSKEMLWYLSSITTDEPPGKPFTGPCAAQLICEITTIGFHDVVLYLLQRYPHLAIVKDDENYSVLRRLAKNPSAFLSGSKLGFWGRCIYPFVPVEINCGPSHLLRGDTEDLVDLAELPTLIRFKTYLTQVFRWTCRLLYKVIAQLAVDINYVRDEKLRHIQVAELVEHVCKQLLCMTNLQILAFFQEQDILNIATSYGILEIVMGCLQFFPDIIGLMVNNRNIFHVAVEHRQEKIFSLLREKTAGNMAYAMWPIELGNTILHLAAKLPASPQLKCVSGSALQIQRELQWFKEVENLAYPSYREKRNAYNETPWELFMKEHKELLESGERWMKETSNSCMVVFTLIATVVFAATFTVPGGNDDNGIPLFLKHNSFMVFAISDALALFSATTSLLTFLSIQTTRYAEEDFLKSLPNRLITGLASLFFAIATMMIAFCAALSIVLGERLKWASIPIASIACFPLVLFATLQLPLFIQMVQSTNGSGIFRKQSYLRL